MNIVKSGKLLLMLGASTLFFAGSAWAADVTVNVAQNARIGEFLTDGTGRTLYVYKTEEGDTDVGCYSYCAQKYPPFTTDGKPVAGDKVDAAKLGTVERKDGSMQVTYNGHPLYYFIGDMQSGDTAGNTTRTAGKMWSAVALEAPAPAKEEAAAAPAAATAAADTGSSASGAHDKNPFAGNPNRAAEGKQVFTNFGCVGCHGQSGGGGMGPSLIDAEWRYGSTDADLFQSIHDGRPKGMPAWGSHLSDDQIWEVITFLRSISTVPNQS